MGVGLELSIEGVGDAALEAAHRLAAGLAGGDLAQVVRPPVGLEPDLSGGGDVDHVVHPAVPRPGEPLQTSYGDLQQEVRQGTVTEVRIEGGLGGADGIDPGVQGVAVVHVYWDTGWPSRVTRIWQATSQSELNSDALAGADAEAVVVGAVDDALRLESPGLDVTFSDTPEPSAEAILGRWELPDSWMALPFVLLAGFFLVLGRGPEPRWATRWAWVWLSLTPVMVLVVPLYVLFGARPTLPGHAA